MFIWILFCTISFILPQNLAKKDEDPCSQFHYLIPEPPYLTALEECPAKNHGPDFYECYAAYYKGYDRQLKYWCWNRLDNNETVIKNLAISTAYVNDDVLFQQLNQPFTSIIQNNGTHTICGANKNWAYPNHDEYFYCPTITGIPVAGFERCKKIHLGSKNPENW